MAGDPAATKRTVGDFMSSPVITAAKESTVQDAAAHMRSGRVGAVVVVEGDRPVGIFTERDLIKFTAAGQDASSERLENVMIADLETVEPDTEVAQAFNQFAERRYRHIPVVSEGRLVGIVSMRDLMKIAQIRPVDTPAIDVPKGLKGVVVAETEVGDVRGTEGFYHYRQYSAVDLSEKRTLEDSWFLLYEGRLPNAEELKQFSTEVRAVRSIPPEIKQLLPAVVAAGEFVPLNALRSCVSLTTSYWGWGSWLDSGMDELKQDAIKVSAIIPTLVAALYRISQGEEPVDPHPTLGHAANYLYMLTGEEPSEAHARAIEIYLTSTIDHGFNASTFTGRVVASTGADLGAAVVAAIGSLSGPLHGGAPSRALDMLDEIKTEEQVDPWIRSAITGGGRIMGFGHPVYKTEDPRSVMLRRLAEDLQAPRIEFAKYVEKRVIELLDELKPGRQLRTNVEFYAAIVMETIGLAPTLFTPTFACSRVIGWTAHILEQAADNRIIRPSGRYIGPPPPQPLD